MDRYYHPSGKYSVQAFPIFILSCLIAMPPLALAYAYLILLIGPNASSSKGILTVLFAIGVMFITIFIIKRGKVRHDKLGIIMGLLSSVIGLYFYWNFFGILSSQAEFNIENILTYIWSDFSIFKEAFSVLGTSFILFISAAAGREATQKPFSEINNIWLKDKKILVNFIEDKIDFVSKLEKGDSEILDHLEKRDGKSESHAVLRLYYTNYGEFYLKARNKLLISNQNNKRQFKKDRFLKNYISIDASSGQKLLSLSE